MFSEQNKPITKFGLHKNLELYGNLPTQQFWATARLRVWASRWASLLGAGSSML